MNKLLLLLMFLSLACSGNAQAKIPCGVGRYEKDLFTSATKKTVQYASATDWNDRTVSLEVDVYEPKGDTALLRPLVIFAHGGGFVQGDKADMAYVSEQFAKRGYVTASIQYRLLPMNKLSIPNAKNHILKAVKDFKTAIGFFRTSSKKFRIDPENIFIGGASAGAITALHVGLLDTGDQLPEDVARFAAIEGGIENVKIKGVINYSGSILDNGWIDKTDPPIFSYHGTADDVVPIGYGVNGKLFSLYGSDSIKQKADEAGLDNILVRVPNGRHTDIYTDQSYSSFYLDFHQQTYRKMRSLVCGGAVQGRKK